MLQKLKQKLKQKFRQEMQDKTSTEDETSMQDDDALQQWALLARMDFTHQHYRLSAQNSIKMRVDFDDKPQHYLSLDEANESQLLLLLEKIKPTGGTLHLPATQIKFSQTLRLPSHIRLIGTDETVLIFNDIDYGIVIENNACHVHLYNLQIVHRGQHQFCAAIRLNHCFGIIFNKIKIHHPRAVGFLLADKVENTLFEHCQVSNAGLVGFMLVRDVHNTELHHCQAIACQQSGIFLTDLKCPPSIDLLDYDGQIHHTIKVIGNFAPFDSEDPAPNRTTLNHCTFKHNRKMGITTDGAGLLRVENCIIAENDCEGITLDNGTWQCQIQNCHIVGNGWRGLQDEQELGIDFVAEMGLMDDGSSKAKLPGISLDNAAFCRIENNCIEQNWGDGVKFVRANYACVVQNNQVLYNNQGENDRFHFFGVLLGNAERQHPDQDDFTNRHNQILNNDILGGHYSGIHILKHVLNNKIENNHIEGMNIMAIEDHNQSMNDSQ